MAALLAAVLMSLGLLAPPAAANIRPDQQWYLDAMNASGLWKVTKGEGVTVAVLDSGVSPTPGLKDKLLPGRSFTSEDSDVHEDATGHGTVMAALIAGSGAGNTLRGLAPEAKILPLRTHVTNDFFGAHEPLIEALRYAARSEAKIINISQGMTGVTDKNRAALQDAINEANKRGKLIFAATGNDGRQAKYVYPAAMPGVVAVGAVDKTGTVTDLSNYGPHLALTAPGDPGGTSQAAAIASASAALIWSKHPDWTHHQVLRVMIETTGMSERGEEPSMYLGYGIVRPAQVLVDGDGDPGPADKSPLFSKYFASLEASKSPSPDAEDAKGDAKNPDATDTDSKKNQAQEKSGSDGLPWVPIGIGAAVLVAAVAVTAVLLAQRRRA
ncbi:S8 family serine peptidase [Streptomyces megasporus]|uniref:S8 family serine peptidase n=1 Tax=Streptomyces megasporus TaxID=44060 RepID=UPI0004E15831|nr:S8 family serine peptidase [Streptomyces megasporus]